MTHSNTPRNQSLNHNSKEVVKMEGKGLQTERMIGMDGRNASQPHWLSIELRANMVKMETKLLVKSDILGVFFDSPRRRSSA